MEISVVGDFNAEELERCLLRYVGTVAPRPPDLCAPLAHLQHNILSPPFEQRHTVWHLRVRLFCYVHYSLAFLTQLSASALGL